MSIAESLKHVSLFSGLDDGARESIARLALARRMPAGRTIFREGDPTDGFYVVLEGQVKVYKLSPDGRQQILHVFGPNQAFAEAAMFAGETFPAFAETLTRSRLAFFPHDRFLAGLGENPALAFGMIASLARLCRQLTVLVGQVTLNDAAGRLARYLTDLCEGKTSRWKRGQACGWTSRKVNSRGCSAPHPKPSAAPSPVLPKATSWPSTAKSSPSAIPMRSRPFRAVGSTRSSRPAARKSPSHCQFRLS